MIATLLAIILLIVFCIVDLIIFNILLENILFYLSLSIFFFITGKLLGFIFGSTVLGMVCFLALIAGYFYKSKKLKAIINANKTLEYPIVYGEIATNKSIFNCSFTMTLSWLSLCKYLPRQLDDVITEKLDIDIGFYELVKKILNDGRGTVIDIKDKDNIINITIK